MRFSASTHCCAHVFLGILALMFIGTCRADEAALLSGADLYMEFCASCHGANATGNGPVAPSLRKKVPDLTLFAKRRGGIFSAEELHRIIDGRTMPRAHGSAEMPIWGWEFYGFEGEDATRRRHVAELIDQLVEYLRSIQRVTQ
jgi:mono/diheme cytochrome c family protein